MKLPPYIIWAVIGAGLIAIGALNIRIGRGARDSIMPWVFKLAWLIMWTLMLAGAFIMVHALFFMGRGNA